MYMYTGFIGMRKTPTESVRNSICHFLLQSDCHTVLQPLKLIMLTKLYIKHIQMYNIVHILSLKIHFSIKTSNVNRTSGDWFIHRHATYVNVEVAFYKTIYSKNKLSIHQGRII